MELSILTFLCVLLQTNAYSINSDTGAISYLQQFGYLEDSSYYRTGGGSVEDETVVTAIKDFQRFAGLTPTGVVDENTITKMNAPRCGVKDKNPVLSRRKRFVLAGSRWTVIRLTYRISKYPSKLQDTQMVDREIARAFKVWSDVTNLSFEKKDYRRVHIDIRFEAGEHGDPNPFYGPGRALAHAQFPLSGGDVHFDDEEEWTINESTGVNLFQVAAHEFGHSLGLNHSAVSESLMTSFFENFDPFFKLHEDDIAGIQQLYGKERKRFTSCPGSDSGNTMRDAVDISNAPDLCQDTTIDTTFHPQNDSLYVFKGDYYWKVEQDRIVNGYPRRILDDWDCLENNLDASLVWPNDQIFFFKGDRYWRFTNKILDSGYPKLISVGFEGIPNDVDAALRWSGNMKTYFFKDDKYWQYDSGVDPPVSDEYPRPISNWKGIPDNLDAAITWPDGKTYFFKGNEYYRFNNFLFAVDIVDPPYPWPTGRWWFSC